jgi:hypothetical protein
VKTEIPSEDGDCDAGVIKVEEAKSATASADTENDEGKKGRKRKKEKKVKTEVPSKDNDDDDADLIKEYGMDDYDDDDDDAVGMSFEGIRGLTYYSTNSEDPYITFKEEVSSVTLLITNSCGLFGSKRVGLTILLPNKPHKFVMWDR